MPTASTVSRFDGSIVGLGSQSGVRVVLGLWDRSPFGPLVDAMIEQPDGHRVLVAPSQEAGDFIAATYRFDEVRVEPTSRLASNSWCTVGSESLQVAFRTGRRTPGGLALRAVPRRLARSPWWVRAIGPVARRVRPGVRTYGTAAGGRQEFYCALDEHRVTELSARWDGRDLGALRPVSPAVRFGFGSTPPRPAVVGVTTLVRDAAR